MQRDTNDLLAVPGVRTHKVIRDSDGSLRCVRGPQRLAWPCSPRAVRRSAH